jgi:hypothetical protein
MSDIRAPAKQECVGILHRFGECLADVVVPVGNRPAAILESAVSIFVFAPRRLDHAVQAREFVHDQLSHWALSIG